MMLEAWIVEARNERLRDALDVLHPRYVRADGRCEPAGVSHEEPGTVAMYVLTKV